MAYVASLVLGSLIDRAWKKQQRNGGTILGVTFVRGVDKVYRSLPLSPQDYAHLSTIPTGIAFQGSPDVSPPPKGKVSEETGVTSSEDKENSPPPFSPPPLHQPPPPTPPTPPIPSTPKPAPKSSGKKSQ